MRHPKHRIRNEAMKRETSKKLKLNNQRENKSYEYTKQEQQTIKSKFREKKIFFPIRTYL